MPYISGCSVSGRQVQEKMQFSQKCLSLYHQIIIASVWHARKTDDSTTNSIAGNLSAVERRSGDAYVCWRKIWQSVVVVVAAPACAIRVNSEIVSFIIVYHRNLLHGVGAVCAFYCQQWTYSIRLKFTIPDQSFSCRRWDTGWENGRHRLNGRKAHRTKAQANEWKALKCCKSQNTLNAFAAKYAYWHHMLQW